jgi:hypothetical protein
LPECILAEAKGSDPAHFIFAGGDGFLMPLDIKFFYGGEMRKVIANYYDFREKRYIPCLGVFHQWGECPLETDKATVPETFAILELENGQVVMARPTDIIFIDEEA